MKGDQNQKKRVDQKNISGPDRISSGPGRIFSGPDRFSIWTRKTRSGPERLLMGNSIWPRAAFSLVGGRFFGRAGIEGVLAGFAALLAGFAGALREPAA